MPAVEESELESGFDAEARLHRLGVGHVVEAALQPVRALHHGLAASGQCVGGAGVGVGVAALNSVELAPEVVRGAAATRILRR